MSTCQLFDHKKDLKMTSEKKMKTNLGTPIARTWDPAWIEEVNKVESLLQKRICGAATTEGWPCKEAPKSDNGRCLRHGGSPNIGGQKGNQNARVHGLYAQRLQTCGSHCLQWQGCPHASEQILKLPADERPNCILEQEEYALLRGGGEGEDGQEAAPPLSRSEVLDEDSALVHIMMSRAASALRTRPMIETVAASGKHYHMETTKMSPALMAFLRLARENHRYHMSAPRFVSKAPPKVPLRRGIKGDVAYALPNTNDECPEQPQGIADIMRPLFEKTAGVVEEALADKARYDAEQEELKREKDPKTLRNRKKRERKKARS
jgi:hypothetical protein